MNGDGRPGVISASNLPAFEPAVVRLGVLATMASIGGTPQSAAPGKQFGAPLQVSLQDSDGNPVQGATVVFTAPSTGPSISTTFGTGDTDASGTVAGYVDANSVAGSYVVTASIGPLSAPFSLTNSLVTPGSFSIAPSIAAPNTIMSAYGEFTGCNGQPGMLVAGNPATTFYSSASQINFLIPSTVSRIALVSVQVICGTQIYNPLQVPIVTAAPSIFRVTQNGVGQADILNQDGSTQPPSAAGTIVSVYATDCGLFDPPGQDGLSHLVATVTATIAGIPATVVYAGEAPGYTSGLQQINILIPSNVPSGAAAPLLLNVGGVSSTQTGVTLAIQ